MPALIMSNGFFNPPPASVGVTRIFGGYILAGSHYTVTTEKYNMATDVRSAGGNMTAARQSFASFAESTRSIIVTGNVEGVGNAVTSSNYYTHASDTAAAGATCGTGKQKTAGFGNSVKGFFSHGQTAAQIGGFGSTNTCEKFTYASSTFAASTAFSYGKISTTATASSVYGWVLGGEDPSILNTVERKNLSTESTIIAGSLNGTVANHGAASSSTHAIVSSGYSGVTSYKKYSYTTQTATTTATRLTTNAYSYTMAGNSIKAVAQGGFDPSVNVLATCEYYTYATDSLTLTASLNTGRAVGANGSTCDAHVGLL